MKTLKLITLLLFTVLLSCKEEKPKTQSKNKVTVNHYICQNNCENSGSDSEGVCPTCNTPYLHNQAFHNSDFLKNGPLNVPDNTQTNTQNTNTTAPAPAQNALGVYHYTCTNGCAGGAGSAANCVSCGNPLAHNQAYHNN